MNDPTFHQQRLAAIVAAALFVLLTANTVVAVDARAATMLQHAPPAKWPKRIPTGLLARLAPLDHVDLYRGSALDRELHNRVSLNKDGTTNISESQATVLVHRYLTARPEALSESLWSRPVVPAGAPVLLLGTAPSLASQCNALFRRHVNFGLLDLQVRRQNPHTPDGEAWQTVNRTPLRRIANLGPLRPGEHAMPLEVRLLSGDKIIWSGTTSLDVRTAEPNEALTPASSPELDATCLAWLDPMYHASEPPRFLEQALTVRELGRVEKLGTDVAIAVRFEIVQDGEIIATGSYAAPGNELYGRCGVPPTVVMLELNWTSQVRPDPAKHPRLRIRGDPDLAVACFSRQKDATVSGTIVWPSRYWAPTIEHELRFTRGRDLWR